MSHRDESDSGGYLSPEEDEIEVSEVEQFYKDKCVFITGVTGFVGKVLLEKLLRSCKHVKTVYVLLREKDGLDPKQRLEELFTCKVFERLKQERPEATRLVVPVCGDISLPGLGISQENAAVLAKCVEVVFHSAATVRFDEPLKKSVDLNLLGTRRVLQLCHTMRKLAALVHVSTAYSYCNRREVAEVVYPEAVSPQRVIEISEWMDDSLLESFLPRLMDGRPTTYHYSKALAETLLQSEGGDLPIAIIRPSIVTASFKEPMPGWVDGVNGPTSFIIMTGKGLLRTMLVFEGSVVDWMPVDLVANLMLTAAWNIGIHRTKGVKVYNCTSGSLNRVTWSDIERTAYPLITKYPSQHVIRYPGGSFKSSRLLNYLSVKLVHSLPAHLIDFISPLFGCKTEFVSLVRRMERAASFLQYFTTMDWTFHCGNFVQLKNQQNATDKQLFDIDVQKVEWTPYLENYVLGVRRHILGEDDSTIYAARRKLARLYFVEKLAKYAALAGFVWFLLTKTDLPQHALLALVSVSFRLMQAMPERWLKHLNF